MNGAEHSKRIVDQISEELSDASESEVPIGNVSQNSTVKSKLKNVINKR